MKLFATIHESITRTDPVVKLLQREGVQNRIVRAVLQIIPLLIAVSIPILLYKFYRPVGWPIYNLFSPTPLTIGNFFLLCIYSGILHFLALPVIVSVKASLLSAQLFHTPKYELVRITALNNTLLILGVLRTTVEQLRVLMIISLGLLVAFLAATFYIGSFASFFVIDTLPPEYVPWIYPNPLPQICLVIGLIGVAALCATVGATASARIKKVVPTSIVMGIGSAIFMWRLWKHYIRLVAEMEFISTFSPHLIRVITENPIFLIVLAIIPYGLAYGAFRLAERWA